MSYDDELRGYPEARSLLEEFKAAEARVKELEAGVERLELELRKERVKSERYLEEFKAVCAECRELKAALERARKGGDGGQG